MNKTLKYGFTLSGALYRMMLTGSKICKSALSTFKEFPVIGWSLSVIGGGLSIFYMAREKKSWTKKVLPIGFELIKLGLATTLLLPLLITAAVLTTLVPIAVLLLSSIASYNAIKNAYTAYKKMAVDPTATNRLAFRASLASAIVAPLLLLSISAMFFIPGAQIIAGIITISLTATQLLISTFQFGLSDKKKIVQTEVPSAQDDAALKEVLTPRPTYLPRGNKASMLRRTHALKGPLSTTQPTSRSPGLKAAA